MALVALGAAAAAPAQAAAPRLRPFVSCPDLVRYADAHAPTRMTVGPLAGTAPQQTTAAEPAPKAPGSAPAGITVPDHSTTNVQEAGVDEPDVVKSDGRRILAIAGGTLYAVDVRGATARLAGSLKLPEGDGAQLLVDGDRLLVISNLVRPYPLPIPLPGPVQANGTKPAEPAPAAQPKPAARAAVAPGILPPSFAPERTQLTEIDVSDLAHLRIVRSLTVDGSYVTARQSGETARVVVQSSPRAYLHPDARDRASGWVPRAVSTAGRSGRRTTRQLVRCRDVRRPPYFAGPGMLSILTVDLAKGLPAVDVDALMTDARTVYGSPSSLYVATDRFTDQTTTGRAPRIAPSEVTTAIHRFDASQPGVTRYAASGSVPGTLLDQFSLSEDKGVLRAASTRQTPGDSESLVTTLGERDGHLAQLGQVGGLGRGERIYAVRFIGDMGYVVTFRQVDPLYTLDLSDPAQPKVAGELKIAGYSAYLHPVSDSLLLGVGQDAGADGGTRGTQLSLFDVSDPRNPTRVAQRALAPGSSSEAEYDHLAFLYWPATKLAVLPVTNYGPPRLDGGPAFMGAVGFRVDRAGIDEVGRVVQGATGDGQPGRVTRALVVGSRLYTLSDQGLKVSRLDTLAALDWLAFPPAAR